MTDPGFREGREGTLGDLSSWRRGNNQPYIFANISENPYKIWSVCREDGVHRMHP